MKYLYIALVFAVVFVPAAVAQKPAEGTQTAAPRYDAELAKRLGADDIGMRKYVLAILRTGPAKITDEAERKKLFAGHFGMINGLAAEGKLSVAGPLNDPAKVYRGIYVFNVDTVDEARKLTETDPSIKAGIFQVEFIEWYSSAGLMEVNSIHNRIQRPKP